MRMWIWFVFARRGGYERAAATFQPDELDADVAK